MYASFGHLTGYSSNYYTYAFDKVIALDFFAQFDPDDLFGCERRRALPQDRARTGRLEARPNKWFATSSAATRSSPPSPTG